MGLLEERRKNFPRAVSYFDAALKSHPEDLFILSASKHGKAHNVGQAQGRNQHGRPHSDVISHPPLDGRHEGSGKVACTQELGNGAVKLGEAVDGATEEERIEDGSEETAGCKPDGGKICGAKGG